MLTNGTDLKMIRGDSGSITLEIEDQNSEKYEFQEGDIVYLTVKESPKKEEIILQKIITIFPENKATIDIEPQDTSHLGYRSYVYDIQLTMANGRVKTVVPMSYFELLPEVTYD